MSENWRKWSDPITMREAYLTMIEFLLTYYKVGGESEKEVDFLIGHVACDPADEFMDPAHEDDWFEAVEKVRGRDAHHD